MKNKGWAIRPTPPHYIYLSYKLTKTNTHEKETRNTNVHYGSNDLCIRFNSIYFSSFIGLHNTITYIYIIRKKGSIVIKLIPIANWGVMNKMNRE